MPQRSFPYKRALVNPTKAFPGRSTSPRPLLPIILANKNFLWTCYALIDSGADDCLMPASFAEKLGFNLLDGKSYEFGGPGSMKQPAWFFEVTLTVGGFSPFPVHVGFTPALERNAIGILGQCGFLDRFIVTFDLRNGLFHIND